MMPYAYLCRLVRKSEALEVLAATIARVIPTRDGAGW